MKIEFSDGSTTTFDIDFRNGTTIMNCFSKEIDHVVSIESLGPCGIAGFAIAYSEKNITMYPNPTNNYINFKGENLDDFSLQILDVNNIIVKTYNNLLQKVNISSLKQGIYFCKIVDKKNDSTIQIEQLIKTD